MSDPLFFVPARHISAGELAEAIGAKLADRSDGATIIDGIAAIGESRPGALVYADGKKHVAHLAVTRASAVICRAEAATLVRAGVAVLISSRPQESFVLATALLFPASLRPSALTGESGVSPAAHISPHAVLESGVIVEAGAVISPGVAVGRGSIIGPGAVVGAECRIGRDCHIGAGCTIQNALIGNRVVLHPGVRVGQDGFGYVPGTGRKIPQIGRVIIQDDVEVGANTTIDRGAIGDTVIGEATKIDNLVQIAHNVQIGRGCVIAAQCGISGSVVIGDRVAMGGQVGMSDHVRIGDGAMIAAKSGLMHDVPAGETWFGIPAQPHRAQLRQIAMLRAMSKSQKSDPNE